MSKKKADKNVPVTDAPTTSQARLELPSEDMERVRRAARSIGLSLSAFIRQAVLEKTVDVTNRMGTKP
jgi:predicted DNA binding CopG/RHH family protein